LKESRGKREMEKEYDVVIIGSGPGGLTAGLYCGRAKLKTLIIEKENLGGAIIDAPLIENWPGAENGISGAELAGNILSQVMKYEIEIVTKVEAIRIDLLEKSLKKVITSDNNKYITKTIIIAGGTRPKKLGIPGEEKFINQGVSYCVMCDGTSYSGKEIAILGGGDNGVTGALYMAHLNCKVTLIEALPELTASKVLQERLKEIREARILCSTITEGIEIDKETKVLRLINRATKERLVLRVDGVFILVGREPQTEFLHGKVPLDEAGFILVTPKMETNIPGIFAAGDIRSGSVMQSISAAGDGATAAIMASRFINSRSWADTTI
jgi:thioredoxin reductase (NADPH)